MKIKWLSKAVMDLKSLRRYIAAENPTAAHNIALQIDTAVSRLSTHPHIGRLGRIPETRELIVTQTSYIIPYRVIDNAIEILRVLHGKMQWPAQGNKQK